MGNPIALECWGVPSPGRMGINEHFTPMQKKAPAVPTLKGAKMAVAPPTAALLRAQSMTASHGSKPGLGEIKAGCLACPSLLLLLLPVYEGELVDASYPNNLVWDGKQLPACMIFLLQQQFPAHTVTQLQLAGPAHGSCANQQWCPLVLAAANGGGHGPDSPGRGKAKSGQKALFLPPTVRYLRWVAPCLARVGLQGTGVLQDNSCKTKHGAHV